MDSLTQVALGGAVGYAVLGSKVGRKAILWGAVLGTLPDLDVFITYDNPVESFTFHRGFSHSLLVQLLISPVIAWLLMKLHKGTEQFKYRWFWLVYLCLSSHAILDSFTVYGTQLLWPLTEYPFGVSNLFIIDPLVTLPLLFGLIVALLPRIEPHTARKMNHIGLALSCVYMTWSLGAKVYIDDKVKTVLAQQGIDSSLYLSSPAPLNTFLWRIVVMADNKYYEGYASVFDSPSELSLDAYPTSPSLLDGIADEWDISRLKWFTKGIYAVSLQEQEVVISDLRMGVQCAYAFNFVVAEKTEEGIKPITAEEFSQRPEMSEVSNIFSRIWDPSISLAPSGNRKSNC
jgi:inner membrane protein